MDTMLGGLDFACANLDDIVIASKSTEDKCTRFSKEYTIFGSE